MPKIQFDNYYSLLELTDKMLQLAENKEWDQLVTFENEFAKKSKSLPTLTQLNIEEDLSPELFEMISKTVENMSRLNEITGTRRVQLQEGLRSLDNQKKVHLAYSEFSNEAIENRMLKDIFKP